MKPNSPQTDRLTAVVAYEDRLTRDQALKVCDGIIGRFWEDLEFDFSWWRFDLLSEPELAREAARAAEQADLVVVAAHVGRELPEDIERWIEGWAEHKPSRSRALVALLGSPEDAAAGTGEPHVFLSSVAQRAGLEYLPHFVDRSGRLTALTLDAFNDRSVQMSSVLGEMLKQVQRRPPEWGINE